MIRPLLPCDPRLWIIFMFRDPRDVIVSRHSRKPDLYWNDLRFWRQAQAAAKRAKNHPRLVTVRYEDLVTCPDDVQQELAHRIPVLTVIAPFSRHHLTANPSDQSVRAMRGLRAVSAANIGAWRTHKPRIVGQLSLHGSLVQELIELGYEPDDSWLESLEAVAPDYRPGHRERRPLARASCWRRWALMIRYVLARRLGHLAPKRFWPPALSSTPGRHGQRPTGWSLGTTRGSGLVRSAPRASTGGVGGLPW